MQRLKIMIDVACALQYLHNGSSTPVVHCDLKPSNILIDEDMVARVTDFSIAKLMNPEESIAYTRTLATFGYVAPEYGSEGIVSTRSDIYSYGIMLMEVFTRRKPSDEMFHGGLSLKSWVSECMASNLIKVIDAKLLKSSSQSRKDFEEELNCISSVMDVALSCTNDSPRDRKNIDDVLATLNKIQHRLSLA
ncbi:hypothetical protein M9H77_19876 [Catharanthus roseus]|uniref:Uncharacterized protein n=1 Tax=Catharanthus roseus TaxID=4058 RepID=A0ACC0BBK7_CATRO|nr:hypothetical protein M9H77_19876 [Catharanthus roseus]